MMLYIASNISLLVIPFNENNPAFHTEQLGENDEMIKKHFSNDYVLYADSSEGCGCGFQHALINNNTDWLYVVDEEEEGYRRNMQQLREYVESVVEKGGKVELYACWDGGFEDTPLSKEAISSDELTSCDFYLKEKGFYTINYR